MDKNKKQDGFKGQNLLVLPKYVQENIRNHPLIHSLYLTGVGFYPYAKYHFVNKPRGVKENILIICKSGKGWCEIGNKKINISSNVALIIPKNSIHSYGADNDDPWTIYWGHFLGEDSILFISLMKKKQFSFFISNLALTRSINMFNMIYKDLNRGYKLQNIISASLNFKSILGILFYSNDDFHPNLQPYQNKKISESIIYMLENIRFSLSLRALANNINVSKSHYIHLFKQKTGYSPIDYFIRLKIQRACQLLATTDLNVEEISYQLGYNDPFYFSRTFSKIMGISPFNFKKNKNNFKIRK